MTSSCVKKKVFCAARVSIEKSEVAGVSVEISKLDIDWNIAHKKLSHHSRDENRKIAKDKGYALIGSWKSFLRHAFSKEKQRSLNSDGKHKVSEKTG